MQLSFGPESTQTMKTMVLLRERFTKSRYTTHQPDHVRKVKIPRPGIEPGSGG